MTTITTNNLFANLFTRLADKTLLRRRPALPTQTATAGFLPPEEPEVSVPARPIAPVQTTTRSSFARTLYRNRRAPSIRVAGFGMGRL